MAAKTARTGITTEKLKAMCATKFAAPAYGSLFEVPDATGAWKNRTADMIAMSVWPSRGLELIGAELKVSRGDWLRECKAPEKAEGHVQFCHRWYLISGPDVVQDIGEIPATWGWLEGKGGRLLTRKEAPELKPEKPSWAFMAGLFRKLADGTPDEMVPQSEVQAVAEEMARDRVEGMKASHEKYRTETTQKIRDLEELDNRLKRVISGAGLNHYFHGVPVSDRDLESLIAVLRLARGQAPFWMGQIERALESVPKNLDEITKGLAFLQRPEVSE